MDFPNERTAFRLARSPFDHTSKADIMADLYMDCPQRKRMIRWISNYSRLQLCVTD